MKRKLSSKQIIKIIKETVREKYLFEADRDLYRIFKNSGATPRPSSTSPTPPTSSKPPNSPSIGSRFIRGLGRVVGGPIGAVALELKYPNELNANEPSAREAAQQEKKYKEKRAEIRKAETVGGGKETGEFGATKFSKAPQSTTVAKIPKDERVVGSDTGRELSSFTKKTTPSPIVSTDVPEIRKPQNDSLYDQAKEIGGRAMQRAMQKAKELGTGAIEKAKELGREFEEKTNLGNKNPSQIGFPGGSRLPEHESGSNKKKNK